MVLVRRAILVGFDAASVVAWNEGVQRHGFEALRVEDPGEVLAAYGNLDPAILVSGFAPGNDEDTFLRDLGHCPSPPPVLIARSEGSTEGPDWTGYVDYVGYVGTVDDEVHLGRVLERAAQFRALQLSVSSVQQVCRTAETQLGEARNQLIQSQRMATLGTMLSGVAHEIKTPLGALNGNNEVLEMASDRIKQKLQHLTAEKPETAAECEDTCSVLDETIRTNRMASDRLLKIVNSARSFAPTNASLKEFVNIHEGIESCLTLAAHELKGRIEVERDFSKLRECECYPSQLNQVILNLLVNAAQAIEGKGKIRIRTWEEDGTIRLSICDNGQGISEASKARIFDTGFTTKASNVGSGLGLSISNSIIENHGGRIEVDSAPGQGSTFTIILPRTTKH